VWRFVLLLVIVAVGSYYAARFLLEGFPRRPREDHEYVRPRGPDDDDEFLSQISRKKGPDDSGQS
jgi:hypothetical protein